MSDLTRISRGEVFYIASRFDTVGSEQKSGRPAVVVSNNMSNEFSPVVEICYLTLQEKKKLPTHVFVDRGQCINSTILCEQITTVSKDRIGDYMCTLPDDIMDAVDKALISSLDLDYIIEQVSKKSACEALASSTPSKTDSPSPDSFAKLQAENQALSEQNKEWAEIIESLQLAVENYEVRLKDAEKKATEAETYKKLYEHILDKLMGR